MRKVGVPFVLLLILLIPTQSFAAETEQSWDLARVVSIEDGDTIKVRLEINKRLRNIRLIGIQAFEKKQIKILMLLVEQNKQPLRLKKSLRKAIGFSLDLLNLLL